MKEVEDHNLVDIALVAIGGYGLVYLSGLLDNPRRGNFRINGVIDPMPESCRRFDEVKALRVPIYDTLEEFYQHHRTDLVLISSPIHLHAPHTCLSLQNGSTVLCEKPLGGAIQEAGMMIEARDRYGKQVGIGYQWSFNSAILNLKKDIQAGYFGAPKRFKTITLWPRDETYYHRNNWAGKQRDADGNWILDSPINNAMAHYLHNMFYVLGTTRETSAKPEWVAAELYRANEIENCDTAALRCMTDNGVELLFYVSHAIEENYGPVFSYEFEQATVRYNLQDPIIRAHFRDGSVKEYGNPDQVYLQKMWDAIDAVHSGAVLACGPEAAKSQTACINGAQLSMPEIVEFPKELVKISGETGKRLTAVAGLADALKTCYEKSVLPSEEKIAWSQAGKKVSLIGFERYPK